VYGIFLAIVGIGSVFATFRYERGIVVARDTTEQHSTLALTIGIATISIPVAYVCFAAWDAFGPSPESAIQQVVTAVPILLALAIGFHGLESAFSHLALKRQAYRVLGVIQAARSAIQTGVQIALAFVASLSKIGLILGAALAPGVVALMLLERARKNRWADFGAHPVTVQSVRKTARDNDMYPKYMVWSALCNSLTNYSLVLLVGSLFSVAAAGAIFLSYRVLMMPTKLLAKNISLVNLQEASELSGEQMTRLYSRRVARMLIIGAGPLIVTVAVAPWLFEFVFGAEWREAGLIAQFLAPAVYLQFVFMSFLTLFTALRAQRTYLAWSVGRLILIAAGIFAGADMGGVHGAAIGFALALAASYLAAHFLLLGRLKVARADGR
jgi:O-antigen/teichoic acid export membrane protein